MDLAGIKGFEIIGGAYGMIKGGLQKKEIKQEYRDSAVRAYCPDCRHRALAQSVENNHTVPMGCYLLAVGKPYNDLGAVVPDNLSVTDALAIFK
jgi:TPP-dependent indolepyruvate ferredoxin oxidoreductase alpha subunit